MRTKIHRYLQIAFVNKRARAPCHDTAHYLQRDSSKDKMVIIFIIPSEYSCLQLSENRIWLLIICTQRIVPCTRQTTFLALFSSRTHLLIVLFDCKIFHCFIVLDAIYMSFESLSSNPLGVYLDKKPQFSIESNRACSPQKRSALQRSWSHHITDQQAKDFEQWTTKCKLLKIISALHSVIPRQQFGEIVNLFVSVMIVLLFSLNYCFWFWSDKAI